MKPSCGGWKDGLNSSKSPFTCRGRYEDYRGLHADGQGKGYPVERVSKLSLHRRQSSLVPFDLNYLQKMAKKRAERREADGISTLEDETKANARNSQVFKGGF